MRRKLIVYAIALVMAATCFVPTVEVTFAASGETTQTADKDADYTGWKKINGKKYYYKKGKIYTGWLKMNGKKYYIKKGRKAKRWVKHNGKWYYCKKGLPVKGIKKVIKINKKTGKEYSVYCEFYKRSGALKRNIGDKMDLKAQKYRSSRKYLVLVSYNKHRVRIYKGKKNKWKRIKNFKCSMGKKSTPTPRGEFKITSRGRYFNTGSNARCWYWTGFIGCIYLFHSVLYNRNSSPTHVIDGRLERNISHGCIRLKLENARWIYRYVPGRTKVVIY